MSGLVEYARRVAAEIRFYDLSGQATGDWSPFLELLLDPTSCRFGIAAARSRAGHARRLAAAPGAVSGVSEALRNLQGDLNQLPEKHLRHYYENGLGLQRLAAASDDVHVIFELAKNAPPTLVPGANAARRRQ